MRKINYDLEVIYVYKLYYFFSLFIFFIPTSLVLYWRFGIVIGLLAFVLGFVSSYFLMMHKKNFPIPDKKSTATKMAKEITQKPSPLTISRFSSQLYFYFNETRQAVTLLEKYQDTYDPLLCATLADLLLREGRPRHALKTILKNPHFSSDPLLLFILGQIFQEMDKCQDAIETYQRSLTYVRKSGFPRNGANRITQFLLTLSYIANIYHSLGDCYALMGYYSKANKHYFLGNIHLFDISLWKRIKLPTTKTA